MASGSLAGAPAAGSSAAAAAAASDSRQLVVPPPRPGVAHLCVEYPGYVGDETKVLETLGGTDGIARQLQVCAFYRRGRQVLGGLCQSVCSSRPHHQPLMSRLFCMQENSKQLALRLRPHDHNCHPAYGAREPSRRLLLRLTRPAPAAEGSGASASSAAAGGWEAEVVATLPHTYRFSSPSDYQYVAHDSRPVDEQGAYVAVLALAGGPALVHHRAACCCCCFCCLRLSLLVVCRSCLPAAAAALPALGQHSRPCHAQA